MSVEKNVSNLTHCVTRLRFNLNDLSKANTEAIKKTKGVMGVVDKGAQYQIIIGNDVSNVYKELLKVGDFQNGSSKSGAGGEKKGFTKIFDIIAGTFTPILPHRCSIKRRIPRICKEILKREWN